MGCGELNDYNYTTAAVNIYHNTAIRNRRCYCEIKLVLLQFSVAAGTKIIPVPALLIPVLELELEQ